MKDNTFISHSRDGSTLACLLHEKMKDAGLDSWMDSKMLPGDDWKIRIEAEIGKS